MANDPIETKVSAQTIATGVATAVAGFLAWLDAVLFYGLPNTAEGSLHVAAVVPVQHLAMFALIPTAAGFLAGYKARHTPRQPEADKATALAWEAAVRRVDAGQLAQDQEHRQQLAAARHQARVHQAPPADSASRAAALEQLATTEDPTIADQLAETRDANSDGRDDTNGRILPGGLKKAAD